MDLKTVLVTQARTGSTRLPGKVLKEINGKSLLQIHLERLKRCKTVTKIIVATTVNEEDSVIFNQAKDWGFNASRGSEADVLDRFYQALKDEKPDWVVRVTSDCPLLDPQLVDEIITYAHRGAYDYVSNGLIENFPDGQDVEVFKFSALETAWQQAELLSEREHVTPYIRNHADGKGENKFKIKNFDCDRDYSHIRMTVDEPKDLELLTHLIEQLGTDKTWRTYTEYIIDNDLTKLNAGIIRNEGFLKSLKKD